MDFPFPEPNPCSNDPKIEDNAALTSLSGLSRLAAVNDDLNIHGNDCQSQEEAEAFAASLSVGGDVTVEGNGVNYPCQ